jgi:hypothetical protein
MLHIKSQLSTLKQYLISNQKNITDGSTTYLDSRIPQKLFICKDTEICKQNLINIYGNSYQ